MISFFVEGIPAPGGSKSVGYRKDGSVYLFPSGGSKRVKAWRQSVADAAKAELKRTGKEPAPKGKPLELIITFHMPRPKYHFDRHGQLKPDAPDYHVSAPDRTKLQRSTEDALKRILWHDDSQVADGSARKIYSHTPGAQITVSEI